MLHLIDSAEMLDSEHRPSVQPPEQLVDLSVIIVNYNVEQLLRRCLETVFASTGDFTFNVCMIDNNSPDGSVTMVKRDFPDVVVIANTDNPGYSAANNQGLREMGVFDPFAARYYLLLNPDTELFPTTLRDAIDYMDTNAQVGVMGPKLLMPDGNLDVACRRSFPTPEVSFYHMLGMSKLFPNSKRFGRYNLTYLDVDKSAEVDSVVGAFMLLRTEAIQKVGLLDEQFWMYGEDLDWAKRIKDADWTVMYNADIVALHVKRASSRQSKRAQFEFVRAMLLFYRKHYEADTPRWLHAIVMLGLVLKGGRPIWREISAPATTSP